MGMKQWLDTAGRGCHLAVGADAAGGRLDQVVAGGAGGQGTGEGGRDVVRLQLCTRMKNEEKTKSVVRGALFSGGTWLALGRPWASTDADTSARAMSGLR